MKTNVAPSLTEYFLQDKSLERVESVHHDGIDLQHVQDTLVVLGVADHVTAPCVDHIHDVLDSVGLDTIESDEDITSIPAAVDTIALAAAGLAEKTLDKLRVLSKDCLVVIQLPSFY